MNPVCPYCSAEVESGDSNRKECPTCGAAHHGDCWEENGGCTVFGCASAPGEGPTLTIHPEELSTTGVPPPPPPSYNFRSPPPPPPPLNIAEPALSLGGYNRPAPAAAGEYVWIAPKNRAAYVLLGIFLGSFGAHNFYAGYTGRGVAQLCITIFTLFFGAFISWMWALVEVCIVDRDSRNIHMV